jgi:cell envelope opacity-associated protein A
LLQTSRTVRRACILKVIFFETQISETSAALKETVVPLEGQNTKRLKTPEAPRKYEKEAVDGDNADFVNSSSKPSNGAQRYVKLPCNL